MRQAIYRAVYRFIVQDGARLIRELEPGLVEDGSLAPAEVAIVPTCRTRRFRHRRGFPAPGRLCWTGAGNPARC